MANTIAPSHLYLAPDPLTHTTMDRPMARTGVFFIAAASFPVTFHKRQWRHQTSGFPCPLHPCFIPFRSYPGFGGGLANKRWEYPLCGDGPFFHQRRARIRPDCCFSSSASTIQILSHLFRYRRERSTEPCFVFYLF